MPESEHGDGITPDADEPRKICSGCREALPPSAFNRMTKARDGLQSYCRDCNREWHRRNRAHHNRMIHKRTRRLREDGARRILDYLRTHPCIDCGEDDPVVLDRNSQVRGRVR